MTTRLGHAQTIEHLDRGPLSQDELAFSVAQAIPHKSYVNLGIGRPTAVASHFSEDMHIVLHTENGMLGMGPIIDISEADPDLVNAGKDPVSELPGAAYFHQADSFGMMRGGHLDYCILGAYQVSQTGDLANWHTGAVDAIPAVGGAMDLAVGVNQVFVMMTLFSKDGESKLVQECTYPLTAQNCVDRIYTHDATFVFENGGVYVAETFGMSFEQLQARVPCSLLRLGSAA